jgi:NAD/NADP transhydrogenase beta subunit
MKSKGDMLDQQCKKLQETHLALLQGGDMSFLVSVLAFVKLRSYRSRKTTSQQKINLNISDLVKEYLRMNIVLSILSYLNLEVKLYMRRFLVVMDHLKGGT